MAYVTNPRRVIPRSRGALSGLLLVVLGIWGGLMPYIGSYFDYTYTPDDAWTWTEGRFWLALVPAVAAILGGLAVLGSRSRASAMAGGWLAVAAGGWFVVGPLLSPLWDDTWLGTPVGGQTQRAVEQVGLFFGLGAAIVLVGAFAVGRMSIVGVRDGEVAERYAARARERDALRAQDREVDERVAYADTADGETVATRPARRHRRRMHFHRDHEAARDERVRDDGLGVIDHDTADRGTVDRDATDRDTHRGAPL